MTALNKQALRQLATDAHELGIIKRYTKGIEANKRFVAIATPLTVLTLLDELEATQKTSEARRNAILRTHNMFQKQRGRAEAAEKRIAELEGLALENIRLKVGISGLIGLGLRYADADVMRLAADAQQSTPTTDGIIENIVAGIGVKGE